MNITAELDREWCLLRAHVPWYHDRRHDDDVLWHVLHFDAPPVNLIRGKEKDRVLSKRPHGARWGQWVVRYMDWWQRGDNLGEDEQRGRQLQEAQAEAGRQPLEALPAQTEKGMDTVEMGRVYFPQPLLVVVQHNCLRGLGCIHEQGMAA